MGAGKASFDGLKKEQFNLGKATLDFYDEREADLITPDEHEYLKVCVTSSHRSPRRGRRLLPSSSNELKEQPSLKSKWDSFVFGTPMKRKISSRESRSACDGYLIRICRPPSVGSRYGRPKNKEGPQGSK